jgi:hypothetical protein
MRPLTAELVLFNIELIENKEPKKKDIIMIQRVDVHHYFVPPFYAQGKRSETGTQVQADTGL